MGAASELSQPDGQRASASAAAQPLSPAVGRVVVLHESEEDTGPQLTAATHLAPKPQADKFGTKSERWLGRKGLAVATVVAFSVAMACYWFGLLPAGLERRIGLVPLKPRPRRGGVAAAAIGPTVTASGEGGHTSSPATTSGAPVGSEMGSAEAPTMAVMAPAREVQATALPAVEETRRPEAPAEVSAQQPTRKDVLNAVQGVSGHVAACGHQGRIFADVTVEGETGRVVNASADGLTGDVGACVARAVRKANFPTFQRRSFRIKLLFRGP